MTEPHDAPLSPAPDDVRAATTGNPPDDRRASPPAPAAAQVEQRNDPATESRRETLETVRSISRLEESN